MRILAVASSLPAPSDWRIIGGGLRGSLPIGRTPSSNRSHTLMCASHCCKCYPRQFGRRSLDGCIVLTTSKQERQSGVFIFLIICSPTGGSTQLIHVLHRFDYWISFKLCSYRSVYCRCAIVRLAIGRKLKVAIITIIAPIAHCPSAATPARPSNNPQETCGSTITTASGHLLLQLGRM